VSARTPRFNAGTASSVRATEAYFPYYAPPVYPVGAYTEGGFAGFSTLPGSTLDERTDKGLVHSKWNRFGDRTRTTFGGVVNKVFKMIATGQVQSSKYQPVTNMPLHAQFNDWLYRAAKGYPRNLGLSEKVPTLPNGALNGTNAGSMTARPQFTRNIFTNRSYAIKPAIPAQPQAQ
jgi:hypothetical protein